MVHVRFARVKGSKPLANTSTAGWQSFQQQVPASDRSPILRIMVQFWYVPESMDLSNIALHLNQGVAAYSLAFTSYLFLAQLAAGT